MSDNTPSSPLTGKTIAFAVANEGIEQVELEKPWDAIKAAGGTPVLISVEKGTAQAFNHLDKGDTFDVDVTFADASVQDYDGLVLPGGVANPDTLRTDPGAVAFVKEFVEAGKPVGAICHAAWTLVEAGVLTGRTLTSWPSLQTDIRNAGATWVDEEVVRDGQLVTSRRPDDLPAFNQEVVSLFSGS
jgi:protease I